MHGNYKVDVGVEDGIFDAGGVAGGVDVRGGDVIGFVHDAGEFTDMVVHGVHDVDIVAGEVELAGEIDGDGEAAVG